MDKQANNLAVATTEYLAQAENIAYVQLAPDLTILHASVNFRKCLSVMPTKIKGILISDLLDEFVGLEDVFEEVRCGQIPAFHLKHVRRVIADGSICYQSYHIIPFKETGTETNLLLIVEDSTASATLEQILVQERNELRLTKSRLSQANDQLARLNRLKSLFLSMAAHDLRTPLTIILGFTQLLIANFESQNKEQQLEYLVTIASQTEWLDQLIANLLSLDQIEENKLSIEFEQCDLNEVVREITSFMTNMAHSKLLTLTIDIPDTPTFAFVDRIRVQQILYNLLGNAVKYTPPEGAIHISLAQNKTQAVIVVADNGRGMSAEEQQRLFELYYRADSARDKKIKGTGLGMFIVKMLVEALNGRIEVDSTLSQGSTFTVRLPTKP